MQWLEFTLVLLISGAGAYMVYRSDRKKGLSRPWITASLRALLLFLVGLLLLSPSIPREVQWERKPVIIWLQDRSASLAENLGSDTLAYIRQLEDFRQSLPGDWDWKLWGFGSQAREDSLLPFDLQATDIHQALTEIHKAYEGENIGAVILASDGQINQGANPLFHQVPLMAPLFTLGIGDTQKLADLEIRQVKANKTLSLGNELELRIQLGAHGLEGKQAQVRILEDGVPLVSIPLPILKSEWEAQPVTYLKPQKPGWHQYTVQVLPVEGEQNLRNNQQEIFVEVIESRKKILLAGAAPHPDLGAIRKALSTQEKWDLEVAFGSEIPRNLEGYDLLILHQIPSQLPSLSRFRNLPPLPIWFILGELSGPGAFTEVQKMARGNFHPGFGNQFLAEIADGFSLFELPARSREVLEKLPPLYVPDGSFALMPSTQILFRQKQKQPPLPLWVFGTQSPPQALLFGTGLWRWRLQEFQHFGHHEVTDQWIQKTVEYLANSSQRPPFRLEMEKKIWNEGESVQIRAELRNPSGMPVNQPEVELRLMGPQGEDQQFSMERLGRHYQLNLGQWASGTYRAQARTQFDGKEYHDEILWTVEAQSLEQRTQGADYARLYSLAQQYGGRFFAYPQWDSLKLALASLDQIRTEVRVREEKRPLIDWKWGFALILLVATGEWFLRKYWMVD